MHNLLGNAASTHEQDVGGFALLPPRGEDGERESGEARIYGLLVRSMHLAFCL